MKGSKRAARTKRSAELRLYGERLQALGVCNDVTPLLSAASRCATAEKSKRDLVYRVDRLNIRCGVQKGGYPSNVEELDCCFSLEATEPLNIKERLHDPFDQLTVSFELTGLTRTGDILKAAWHLDRHQGGPSAWVHPNYHFHCGGFSMSGVDLGASMLLASPRLMHPPMDAVLGVDFALANFSPSAWQKCRADSTYERIVRDAAIVHFLPHYFAVANLESTGNSLCPWL